MLSERVVEQQESSFFMSASSRYIEFTKVLSMETPKKDPKTLDQAMKKIIQKHSKTTIFISIACNLHISYYSIENPFFYSKISFLNPMGEDKCPCVFFREIHSLRFNGVSAFPDKIEKYRWILSSLGRYFYLERWKFFLW